MDEKTKQKLFQRNKAIIEAVKVKAERVCPGAIDLIAVSGSFCSGDYYEKSDLDLLIVINDSAGRKISKCFILGDTAHDIYCHTWEKLESMAEYRDPHVIKLMDVDIVYCSDETAKQRYLRLKEQLSGILSRPLEREDLEKAKGYFQSALAVYGRLCMEEDFSRCKYLSAYLICDVEYALYLMNKEYIRHGIQGIPKEICALKILPERFEELYFAVIGADNLSFLRQSAETLLKNIDCLMVQTEEKITCKKEISAGALRGTYEEVYSNWKNKMHRAAGRNDPYLSLMTAAGCQNFYDELYKEYRMERIDLFEEFQAKDLEKNACQFDSAMEKLKALYEKVSLPVCRYESIEEFTADYTDSQ